VETAQAAGQEREAGNDVDSARSPIVVPEESELNRLDRAIDEARAEERDAWAVWLKATNERRKVEEKRAVLILSFLTPKETP
jgi:hypothetical protein